MTGHVCDIGAYSLRFVTGFVNAFGGHLSVCMLIMLILTWVICRTGLLSART